MNVRKKQYLCRQKLVTNPQVPEGRKKNGTRKQKENWKASDRPDTKAH